MIEKPKLAFDAFIGIEQQRLFGSIHNFGELAGLIPEIADAIDACGDAYWSDNRRILLLYFKYYFYASVSEFYRGHYSIAFACARNAIETSIHGQNIQDGEYSFEEYIKSSSSKPIKASGILGRKLKNKSSKLSETQSRVLRFFHFASDFGSHAGPGSFRHRLTLDDKTKYWSFNFFQSRSLEEDASQFCDLLEALLEALILHLEICENSNMRNIAALFVMDLKFRLSKMRDQL